MNLRKEIDKTIALGYNEANAESKLCQDIVLKAIADSNMVKNATVKGGVVMRSISGNARRATQDFDLDFIRYSISDESIRIFVEKLNCVDGLNIYIKGDIQELKHQDYKGKRITLYISDDETTLSLKMDIGVHNDLSINQEEYGFHIGFQDDVVSLLVNSRAQMIAEKLKSLVRFGTQSTRYKDIFDIYYLSLNVDEEQLKRCIQKYIFDDSTLQNVSSMEDITSRVERVFKNRSFLKLVNKSEKNWLDIPIEEVFEKNIEFLKRIKLR